MEESIFTKIIKGELPCHKIYEDDLTLAFLDIHPTVDGHTLVIPKTQVEFIWDLSDDDYCAVMETVKKVGRRLREVMEKQYVGVMVVGTDVPHAHVQILPFNEPYEMKRTAESANKNPDHSLLAEIAEKIRFT